jgi:hypothetical protein
VVRRGACLGEVCRGIGLVWSLSWVVGPGHQFGECLRVCRGSGGLGTLLWELPGSGGHGWIWELHGGRVLAGHGGLGQFVCWVLVDWEVEGGGGGLNTCSFP